MNYWIITDTHFGHENIKKYTGRPDGFEYSILKNTENIVKDGDVLIHLGDFSFGNDSYWHNLWRNIKGNKILIRGNHDKKSLTWYMENGWDMVVDEMLLNIYGKRILFSHKPISDRGYFDLNIHGHQHNTVHHPETPMGEKNRLVFIEHNYAPINLRSIVER